MHDICDVHHTIEIRFDKKHLLSPAIWTEVQFGFSKDSMNQKYLVFRKFVLNKSTLKKLLVLKVLINDDVRLNGLHFLHRFELTVEVNVHRRLKLRHLSIKGTKLSQRSH